MENRYELRSLKPKSRRFSITFTYEESSQLLSPPPKRKKAPLIKGGFANVMSSEEAQYMSIIRDKLSDSDSDSEDEGSQAIVGRYAMIALGYAKKYGNFELVSVGPLAAGNISGGRIFHLNYEAKNNDLPNAKVETFFAEITKTNKDAAITLLHNCFLGPSDSLPGSLYKLFLFSARLVVFVYGDVLVFPHYFTIISIFIAILLQRRLILMVASIVFLIIFTMIASRLAFEMVRYNSGIPCLLNFLTSTSALKRGMFNMKEKNFSPKFSHPGIVYEGEEVDSTETDYANAALHMFNLEQNTNFELMRIGSSAQAFLPLGFVIHLNFEAKRNDDPEAPMHTFFAQVIQTSTYFFAHFCKCLGQSDSLPDEIELHGCQYCIPPLSPCSPCVRHPPGRGYLTGRNDE